MTHSDSEASSQTSSSALDSLQAFGKAVLVRSDLNVPLSEGAVTDDYRIRASLPTINKLREQGAIVAVCSHLGRPEGVVDPSLRMMPVAAKLAEIGGFTVTTVPTVAGEAVQAAVDNAQPGDVLVLENTRFEPGEVVNDLDLASALAEPFDAFVLDAFGTAHRAHASTVGVTNFLPSYPGLLLEAEIAALGSLLVSPGRPYTVVLGGAKVSDKLKVIEALLPLVDHMIIGGGMCFTALSAQGYEIGASLVEPAMVNKVKDLLASEHGCKIMLPVDVVVAPTFSEDAVATVVPASEIPADQMGLDIGPESAQAFSRLIGQSAAVFWNGPMGVFEWESFRSGTLAVANSLASSNAFTVVGGGDSVAAIRLFGLDTEVSHVSTGGGAGLKLLEGEALPGLAALRAGEE